MQPMFHRQKVAGFGTLMAECTLQMLDRWRRRAEQQEPFDVVPEMMRLTLQIVGRALLSMDLTAQTDLIGRNMTIANERLGSAPMRFHIMAMATRQKPSDAHIEPRKTAPCSKLSATTRSRPAPSAADRARSQKMAHSK
jgi:cytochrome P450